MMKTQLYKRITTFLWIMLLIPVVTYAQESETPKDFHYAKSDATENIPFTVDKATEKLEIRFEGGLVEGAMKIKITDPDGNVISGFSLVCSGHETGNNGISTGGGATVGRTDRSERSTGRSSARSESRSARSTGRASVSTHVSVADSVTTNVNTSSTVSDSRRIESTGKKDKKTSTYSYEKTESDASGARGVMVKEIENPAPGKWKYTVITESASGQLSVKIVLH